MDTLSKLRTALAERYEIEREIGAGGMATVYLARDPRHDRNVALKVLNPELGAVLGVERFLAEIKVTANLQHPNLLPLFDSGEADGLLFYVMPFVDGESLRARLDREKQLPIDEAIRIAVAVANALDYAHVHHVIHRDLKPENILLQAGQPVVADFGIALAVSKAGGNRVTQTGLSLGTPQYMSPEQATGDRVIDGRTDIYSLGALTYEMLAGEPPHIGQSAQAIIARLLTDKPRSVRTMRPAVPEHVDAAVAHALEKLPADRFTTAREFAEALQGRGAVTVSTTSAAPARSAGSRDRLRDPVLLGTAGVAVVAIAVAAMARGTNPVTALVPPIRFVLTVSDSTRPLDNFPWPAAISPDGRTVVYSVNQRSGGSMLYVQRTDQLEPRPLAGTLGAYQPYFSPDGEWLAFQQASKERKMRFDGSAPVTIADGGSANGADWTINGEIVSGANLSFRGLGRVSAAGGVMTEFTQPDTAKNQRQHVWPIAVPDGDHVVFTIWYGNLEASQLAITSLADGRVSELGIKGIRPLGVLDDRLVYLQADGTIMAVRLDAKRRRVIGNAVPVHDPVPVVATNNGNSGAYLSRGGALITSRGNLQTQLIWLSRDGSSRRPVLPDVRTFYQPILSPDERRLLVLVADESQRTDVWVFDFATNTFSRLTTSGTVTSASWSVDGSHVFFTGRGERERTAFWRQPASGGSAPEKLMEVGELAPAIQITPDGRWVLYQAYYNNTWDFFRARLDSTPVTGKPYVATPANEMNPRMSPDGKWAAFLSDESGRSEVYVRSFPDPSSRIQVSAEGAGEIVWADDGKTIYYRSGDALLTATVELSPMFRVIRRDTLLTTQMPNPTIFGTGYDVARDGRIVALFSNRDNFELVVSPNWITEFRERIAASERNSRR